MEQRSAAERGRRKGEAEALSTSQRILRATADVLDRAGPTKLSISEVALEAGVTRATLYRWFSSKEELLRAFFVNERHLFEAGMSQATAGLSGAEELDAALAYIVDYQESYSGARLIDSEPEMALAAVLEVIPLMRARLQRMLPGESGEIKAATAIRVAVSHYVVRGDDADQFLAQLRHAVGLHSSDGQHFVLA